MVMRIIDTTLLKQEIPLKRNIETGLKINFNSVNQSFDKQAPNTFLKIAIVTETWSPEINGVANSLINLSAGLQKIGHKILLIRPRPKQICTRFRPEMECWVKAQVIPKYSSLQFGWPEISKIDHAIEQFQPDVVHIVTEGPLGLAALFVARRKQIPVSSGYHSTFQEFSRFFNLSYLSKPIRSYLSWFHNRCDMNCVPSLDTELMLNEMGVHKPIQLVGRGVDTALFHPKMRSEDLRNIWGADQQTRVLISVGRLSPEKEVNVVIESYRELIRDSHVPCKLVVVGDGPDAENLRKQAVGLDVIFTGSLVGVELATAYASADVFVFPSRVETFGNVTLEALASGLAVIAYDYACAALHIQHEHTGWLIPFGDVQKLKQAVNELPDVKLISQMGDSARKQVLDVGWQQPVQQFQQALLCAISHAQKIKD